MTEPQCPTCGVPMAVGFLPDRSYASTFVSTWVTGKPEFSFVGNAKVNDRPQYFVQAYRCPRCGLVHPYALRPGS